MRTLRGGGAGVRVRSAIVVVVVALVLAACGSSSSTSGTGPTETSTTVEAPAIASSIPPPPSTNVPSVKAPCSALTSALVMSELRPKNSGNWPAERQRIITDAAANVELFSLASDGVPSEVAKALETLKAYSTWLGTTMANSSSYDAAISAVNAYPDLVGASLAASVVDTWKRKNC